jgi:hypothetical protein
VSLVLFADAGVIQRPASANRPSDSVPHLRYGNSAGCRSKRCSEPCASLVELILDGVTAGIQALFDFAQVRLEIGTSTQGHASGENVEHRELNNA